MTLGRTLHLLVYLALMRMPAFVSAAWFAGRRTVYKDKTIDAKAQTVGTFLQLSSRPEALEDPDTVRAGYVAGAKVMDSPGPAMALVSDQVIPLSRKAMDEIDLPVRIYDAVEADLTPSTPRPTFVFIHGGGFVIGDLETHHGACTRLAKASGMRVVALDYKLAPEHPFPAAPNQILMAYDWLRAEGHSLGVDGTRMAVGGDSAGGNLTAVLMHDLKARGSQVPKAQVLIYPAVGSDRDQGVFQDLAEGYVLPKPIMEFFFGNYIKGSGINDMADPRLAPLHSPHLAGQPPAHVLTCGHDPLGPEGEAYAAALRAAGVEVTQKDLPGMIHGFINFCAVLPDADRELADIGTWLKARV